MFSFLLRRLLLSIPVLFGLMALVFLLTRTIPSDPAAVLAGDQATPEQVAAIRTRLGLDRPLPTQFAYYIRQIATGDFGTSLYTHRPVAEDLVQRLPATVELGVSSLLLAFLIGVPLGVVSAVHRNTWIDYDTRGITTGGLAVAAFWMAIILQLVFSMYFNLLPLAGRIAQTDTPPQSITGLYVVDYLLHGNLHMAWQALLHLVLPTITLALPAIATLARFMRSSMMETLQKDFIAWERAVGYGHRRLIWIYALRNSLSATVTQLGLIFGMFLSGSVIVEAIYDWPGLGDYLYLSITTSDYAPILATTLLIGAIYALVNIAVDLLQAWIDPRVGEQQ